MRLPRILLFRSLILILSLLALSLASFTPTLAAQPQPTQIAGINTSVVTDFSSCGQPVELDGVIYVTIGWQYYGSELWHTDGTDSGTWLVKDLLAKFGSGVRSDPVVVGSALYFAGDDGSGTELWRYDMDGDIFDLPDAVDLCHQYGAYLMVDEAHSLGVLGTTGHGIEEYFGLEPSSIDVQMGTLSKTIPSAGGYIAGSEQLIELLKHNSRGFVYSAALPPAQVAVAREVFHVIEREQWRLQRLRENSTYFRESLKQMGFNILNSQTAIVPVICGGNQTATRVARHCQKKGVFVQGIPAPVVPEGLARLRCILTCDLSRNDIDFALEVIQQAGRTEGII